MVLHLVDLTVEIQQSFSQISGYNLDCVMDQLGMVTLRPTFYHTYQEHVFTDVEPCPFIN